MVNVCFLRVFGGFWGFFRVFERILMFFGCFAFCEVFGCRRRFLRLRGGWGGRGSSRGCWGVWGGWGIWGGETIDPGVFEALRGLRSRGGIRMGSSRGGPGHPSGGVWPSKETGGLNQQRGGLPGMILRSCQSRFVGKIRSSRCEIETQESVL